MATLPEGPLRIERRGDERVLMLDGELDMADTGTLTEAAGVLVAEPGDLTLDLHGLTFIDSSGLLAPCTSRMPSAAGSSSCRARRSRCRRSSTWSSWLRSRHGS